MELRAAFRAACAALIVMLIPSIGATQNEPDPLTAPSFDVPGVPLPAAPPPVSIVQPVQQLVLGADDRALIARIDARVGEIIAEIESAR
jgi:hypothetical protein